MKEEEKKKKRGRGKKQTRSVIPYGAVYTLFNEPNQCIDDMKTYLLDEDNQAPSHTTFKYTGTNREKKSTRNTLLWKWWG